MSSARVIVFMGTRPEAIKLAPVVRALEGAGLDTCLVSTGQHRELLAPVVRSLGLVIAHDLAVMRAEQSLAELTARLLVACDEVLTRVQPSFALVQGDTTTVLAASLACFYRGVAVGHVEAGLRTFDPASPFPEELNRQLAARLVALHFAPTERARRNLLAEGVSDERIAVTGNTVLDALHAEVARQARPEVAAAIEAGLARALGGLGRPLVLVTGHRRENFGRGLSELISALLELAQRFEDHDFVYPVHLNPRVYEPVHARLGGTSNIKLIAPRAYDEFVALLRACRLVLTDSGGIQEEAPSLGKPVLVMRTTTERPEAIEAGTVRLVEPNAEHIVREVSLLLSNAEAYERMARATNPYGDGRAAERIVARVQRYLESRG